MCKIRRFFFLGIYLSALSNEPVQHSMFKFPSKHSMPHNEAVKLFCYSSVDNVSISCHSHSVVPHLVGRYLKVTLAFFGHARVKLLRSPVHTCMFAKLPP